MLTRSPVAYKIAHAPVLSYFVGDPVPPEYFLLDYEASPKPEDVVA